ncbi:MAG TPA: hypothetical protein VK574_11295 [Terracidiphilus sp.]|nr:hypothetical protein [Terracidiphilus sp.]
MSTDIDNKNPINRELTWIELIQAAEERVNQCQIEIKRLYKSIVFFKKQQEAKIPFPQRSGNSAKRHLDLS